MKVKGGVGFKLVLFDYIGLADYVYVYPKIALVSKIIIIHIFRI